MRYVISVTAAVVLATFTAHAFGERWQTTPQPVPTPADTQPMTVLGCIQTWDPTTLTAGSLNPAGGPTQYVLTDVETPPTDPPPARPGAPEPPTPSTAAPTAAGAHSTYLLSSMPRGPDLADFVDQKVEVSGALVADGTVPPTPGTPPPAAAPAPQTSRTTPPPRTPPAAFKVATIKVVAKTCS